MQWNNLTQRVTLCNVFFIFVVIEQFKAEPANDMTVEQKIILKISEAAPVLEQIPGVVIVHYLKDASVVYMSRRGLAKLNVTLEELREMGPDYHHRFFNQNDAADYVPKVLGLLERNNDQETVSFFQQVRASKDSPWEWYASGTRIFMRDDDGHPFLTITVAIPVDPKHFFSAKIDRLLGESEFLTTNQHLFSLLTKREKQILCLMAKNVSSLEIASDLYLSEATIKTHRRNIKKKLGVENQYDIIKFAQAFNLI